jgi:two-component system sensor histidine kinase ResE
MVRSKDEFVASVSHELRTPLTIVVGMANELRDRSNDLTDEEVLEFIGLIADQGNEVANIVEDLLVVARADIDRVSVVPAAVDLREMVQSVGASLPGGLQLGLYGAAPLAWADPTRVRQIIRNLCTNAIRYGGSEVRIDVGTIGENVRLEVSDNGRGVDERDHDRIFEAYHRAHDRRGQPGAIGLGLTVSKRLAQLMGGDLTYFRRDDWSVFSLSLPLATGAENRSD